jgi:S1-C subfamily serine protease
VHRRLARAYGLVEDTGVLVVSVEPNSPAQRAGLREHDIIVNIGGNAVAAVDDLHRWLVDERIGVSLPLIVLRGSERVELHIVPIEQPHPA